MNSDVISRMFYTSIYPPELGQPILIQALSSNNNNKETMKLKTMMAMIRKLINL